MICLIQLQAAMGFGILLLMLAFALLFIVLPVLYVFFINKIKKRENGFGKDLSTKDYLLNHLEALLNAFFTTLAISVFLGLLIWWMMRDVVFM